MANKKDKPMGADGGVIGVKVAVELMTRAAPKGIKFIVQWLRGKRILVVGQQRAGKTSFVRYLRYGIFADPSDESPRTLEIERTAAFTVSMGRKGSLKLEVADIIDAVGQAYASDHVNNVGSFSPHAVIIILNLSSSWRGKDGQEDERVAGFYLEEFATHLSELLRERKSLRKKLQSIIVVLNKKDEISPRNVSNWKRLCKRVLKDKLLSAYGPKTNNIPVMECTLIENTERGRTPDAIITRLALSLAT